MEVGVEEGAEGGVGEGLGGEFAAGELEVEGEGGGPGGVGGVGDGGVE